MKQITPNSVMQSMEQALEASSVLIDGRTERDWFCFLTEFAALVNFYDDKNQVNGNWQPFLAKDPVLLLAAVSKTSTADLQINLTRICSRLPQLLHTPMAIDECTILFNHLFQLQEKMFLQLRQWVSYMLLSSDSYPLKSFVISRVQDIFSSRYWALVSLRQQLYLTGSIPGIKPAAAFQFGTDGPEAIIWKLNKDKTTFWEVLNLKYPVTANTENDLYTALKNAADELLLFLNKIISKASLEFEMIKTRRCQFPDTLLLRSFVHLLKTQQQQLNNIAPKHLQFYYETILRQQKKSAVADKVFVTAILAKKDAVLQLPAATLFDAGLDADGNPLLFASEEAVSLNPATLTDTYTLGLVKEKDDSSRLYLQTISGAGIVKKDDTGNIQSWATFGGTGNQTASEVKPAIAIASPMLLLREGRRCITVSLQFANPVADELLSTGNYFISTDKAWLPLNGMLSFPETATDKRLQASIVIVLDETQPPVQAFIKNPDSYNSQWPLLKIEWNSWKDYQQPPVLTAITIAVSVSGIKTFQLYNDFGLLNTKVPFQLLGPMPVLNSSFIIGSNEIFSKPVDTLNVKFDWDKLPEFFTYYQQYNAYIQQQDLIQEEKQKSWLVKAKDAVVKPFIWLWKEVKQLFSKNNPPPDFKNQFNNACFTVQFTVLQQSWSDFPMQAVAPITLQPTTNSVKPASTKLFRTEGADAHLSSFSCFYYENSSHGSNIFFSDPALQLQPLQFTDTSTSGFIRMSLAGPDYGFGSSIYPNVVNYIALQNTKEVAYMAADEDYKPAFLEPANPPFAPKLASITGQYTASVHYDLTAKKEGYPLQCFLYTPFSAYAAYDNNNAGKDFNVGIDVDAGNAAGLSLIHPYRYNGYLFAGMKNLVQAGAVSFYFELARKYAAGDINKKNCFFYLSTSGWKTLPLLSDGTLQFSCSGIIKAAIPADIDPAGKCMPGSNYWIAIAAAGDISMYSETVYLSLNGMLLSRSGLAFKNSNSIPKLLPATIKKVYTPMPQIAAVLQPFASFGGRAAEDEKQMQQRLSGRINTKDRAVTSDDFFRLIRQEFRDIYYSKTVFRQDESGQYVAVYLVKAVPQITDANAFIPLVSESQEAAIQQLLQQRVNAFTGIVVSNFNLQYVQVIVLLQKKDGYSDQLIQDAVANLLNFYLSPWIVGAGVQTVIDEAISNGAIAALIRSIDGVADVSRVSFVCSEKTDDFLMSDVQQGNATAAPMGDNYLMVSGMNHVIKCVNSN